MSTDSDLKCLEITALQQQQWTTVLVATGTYGNIKIVLFSSEASGQLWNTCVRDATSTTSLVSYKGGCSAPRTMCIISGDYLISAANNKPLIHVWALHRQEQVQLKMVMPGCVNALTVSPDGQYCVAAVSEKLHVWQVQSGRLLAVITGHYQPVSVVRFSDDGSHFITGGLDNLVFVWFLSHVVKQNRGNSDVPSMCKPRHTWSSHSLPVTDIHVGKGGVKARVATASLDHTVKLWELASGRLVLNVVFESGITSVTLDNAEISLYAGSCDGQIYRVNLFEKPARTERHITVDDPHCQTFSGHSKQVTCLAMSLDGSVLASGSHDASVKLWDVPSQLCSKTLPHKGPITNVLLVAKPRGLEPGSDSKTASCLQPVMSFQRHLQESGDGSDANLTVGMRLQGLVEDDVLSTEVYSEDCEGERERNYSEANIEEVHDLKKQIQGLQAINKQLYDHAIKMFSMVTQCNRS